MSLLKRQLRCRVVSPLSHGSSRWFSESPKGPWDLKKAHIISTTETSDTKWVKTWRIEYERPDGKSSTWEYCSRTKHVDPTTDQHATDAVVAVAVLQKPDGPELLVQKQFRPPTGAVTIEMPAGLLDANETVEECAIRELREETGYVGVAQSRSPPLSNDPGFSNCTVTLVNVTIDLTLKENQDPQPQLEDNEFIENFSLPIKGLKNRLDEYREQGYAICTRLYSVALGLELGVKY